MAKVMITQSLQAEVIKKFKAAAKDVFLAMKALETSPKKGKALGHVQEIVINELKYGKFRFYFITDGQVLKFGTAEELATVLIKFVRVSEKKDQQQTIENIKNILTSLGFEGF